MKIAIQLPLNTCEILNSVWSDAVDVEMFYAVYGLLIYDYYFVLNHHYGTPQLDMFGPPPAQVTQVDIADELYELNLSSCADDFSKVDFIKTALEWFKVVIPYTDVVMSKYGYLELKNVTIDEHFDDQREGFQTYVFLEFSQ